MLYSMFHRELCNRKISIYDRIFSEDSVWHGSRNNSPNIPIYIDMLIDIMNLIMNTRDLPKSEIISMLANKYQYLVK